MGESLEVAGIQLPAGGGEGLGLGQMLDESSGLGPAPSALEAFALEAG